MAVKTRAELKSENTSDFPDNSARLISPADLRGQMDDTADSMLMLEDIPTLDLSEAPVTANGDGTKTLGEWTADIVAGTGGGIQVDIYNTIAQMLASGELSYSGGGGNKEVAAGDLIRADQYLYTVQAAAEANYDLVSADGVKLRVRATPEGWFPFAALNPVADGVTDNWALFNAAMAATKRDDVRRIVIPAGKFFCSKCLNVYSSMEFVGASGGSAGYGDVPWPTEIIWPTGTIGMSFHLDGTVSDDYGHNLRDMTIPLDGAETRGSHAHGSAIEHLLLKCTAQTGDFTIDNGNCAVFTRVQIRVEEVLVWGWQGDGFRIYGTTFGTSVSPLTAGNVSQSIFYRPMVRQCGGRGIKVGHESWEGGNCSAITFILPDIATCWGGAIYDFSLLGNTYIGIHTNGNGKRGQCSYWDGVSTVPLTQPGGFPIPPGGTPYYKKYHLINEGPYYSTVTSGAGPPGTQIIPPAPGGGAPAGWLGAEPSYEWARDIAPFGVAATGGGPGVLGGTPSSAQVWRDDGQLWPSIPGTTAQGSFVEWKTMASGGGVYAGIYRRAHVIWCPEVTARNTFVSTYFEDAQTPMMVTGATMFIGGNAATDRPDAASDGIQTYAANGFVSYGKPFTVYYKAPDSHNTQALSLNADFTAADKEIRVGGENSELMLYINRIKPGGTDPAPFPDNNHLRVRDAGAGDIAFEYSGSSGRAVLWTGPTTTLHFGRTVPSTVTMPGYFAVPRLIIGGADNNGRLVTNGIVAPTTGQWARGDIVFNREPAVGEPLGWICVAAGSPGTWAATAALV